MFPLLPELQFLFHAKFDNFQESRNYLYEEVKYNAAPAREFSKGGGGGGFFGLSNVFSSLSRSAAPGGAMMYDSAPSAGYRLSEVCEEQGELLGGLVMDVECAAPEPCCEVADGNLIDVMDLKDAQGKEAGGEGDSKDAQGKEVKKVEEVSEEVEDYTKIPSLLEGKFKQYDGEYFFFKN